ncbi:MAG: hypothetical protein KDJ90_00570 [Nitratireductor sp.]|nr:hypothetical protein [Nitratireductor sp.]
MKSDLVDINCRVVSDDPSKKAIAIADGTEEDDPRHEGRKREKWFWLPRSQVEAIVFGTGHIVTMPEWLAKEKGLI